MSKETISKVLEDLLGEYILNISKDNLKVAILRGTIKLDNVQLDGDLIGSHILSAVGLTGFGVLSCWAHKLRLSVTWSALEKEPTKIEIRGMHLLCVPLLQSTATLKFGSGTASDPRCSLRTRAKRSALARFERNFFAGRISGEGSDSISKNEHTAAIEETKDSEFNEKAKDVKDDYRRKTFSKKGKKGSKKEKERNYESSINALKTKLKAKIVSNIEASIKDLHIRCEVPENALFFENRNPFMDYKKRHPDSNFQRLPADRRSFAFGFTLDNFIIKTANSDWQTGDIKGLGEKSVRSSSKKRKKEENLSIQGKKFKVYELNGISIYWDDCAPFLISKPLLSNSESLPKDLFNNIQAYIVSAMDALTQSQNPGESVRKIYKNSSKSFSSPLPIEHKYVCESLSLTFRALFEGGKVQNLSSCISELLRCDLQFQLKPQQLLQYYKLKSAMLTQRRLDTMLHQRPSKKPLSGSRHTRAWWHYIIACVVTRPNVRPWRDVMRIVQARPKYIELVVKKKVDVLSANEREELLRMEDLLPIEALQAFHLIALRDIFIMKMVQLSQTKEDKSSASSFNLKSSNARFKNFNLLRRPFGGKQLKGSYMGMEEQLLPSSSGWNSKLSNEFLSRYNQTSRSQKDRSPHIQLSFVVHDISLALTLVDSKFGKPIIKVNLQTSGVFNSFDPSHKNLNLNVESFHIIDCLESDEIGISANEPILSKILMVQPPQQQDRSINIVPSQKSSIYSFNTTHKRTMKSPGSQSALSFPNEGSVFQVQANFQKQSLSLGISAHPATLVWKKNCIDAISDFISYAISETETVLSSQLRNSATPLAHKAQLALMSPLSVSVNICINAPKLWIPVSAKNADGALYLDAGLIHAKMLKKELSKDTTWEIEVSRIQVQFYHRMLNDVFNENENENKNKNLSSLCEKEKKEDRTIHIILPFHIRMFSMSTETTEIKVIENFEEGSCLEYPNKVYIEIGNIILNLVDADILATAIGRWYAIGLAKQTVKRNHQIISARESQRRLKCIKSTKLAKLDQSKQTENEIPFEIHFDVDQIEMNLESVSSKCTYRICIVEINIQRKRSGFKTYSSFELGDMFIIQERNASKSLLNHSEKEKKKSSPSRVIFDRSSRQILTQSKKKTKSGSHIYHELMTKIREEKDNKNKIVTASHIHDRKNYLDEIEIDVESITLHMTPTSLQDCLHCLNRIFELVQLMTREMERKVHAKGRKDRNRGAIKPERRHRKEFEQKYDDRLYIKDLDSSILFKISMHKFTILAGYALDEQFSQTKSQSFNEYQRQEKNAEVVQLIMTALIMFQSIEDENGRGTKTLHVSAENLSASLNTKFQTSSLIEIPPIIPPTTAEIRLAFVTEDQGNLISQELSFVCDTIKVCLTPDDLYILSQIFRTLIKIPQSKDTIASRHGNRTKKSRNNMQMTMREKSNSNHLFSILQYKKKGSGIAMCVRFELQVLTVILIRTKPSKCDGKPLFDFNINNIKGKFEGCVSAMSGELSSELSMNFFNTYISEWEYVVEPSIIVVAIDQMPNEFNLSVASPDIVNMNLTGVLLRDLAEMDFSIYDSNHFRMNSITSTKREDLPTSAGVGTEIGSAFNASSQSLHISNHTGCDFFVCPMKCAGFKIPKHSHIGSVDDSIKVRNGEEVSLKSCITQKNISDLKYHTIQPLAFGLSQSSESEVGRRKILYSLPTANLSENSKKIHKLIPLRRQENDKKYSSNKNEPIYYEPVVEWCIQNQRLRSSTVDVYSIEKGKDLLSSQIWSPCDNFYLDLGHLKAEEEKNSFDLDDEDLMDLDRETRSKVTGNWLKPYLTQDAHEWTDMTNTLRLARERVMLPDSNWIWVNDWTVDLSGEYCITTDGDGWEYSVDFPEFNRSRRYYKRGDTCRRRRWTRTRIFKPPPLKDPFRPLSLVWETKRSVDGNLTVVVRSNLTLINLTSIELSFFAFSFSWEDDQFIASIHPGDSKSVPISLATATYIRFGKKRHAKKNQKQKNSSITSGFVLSERLLILPTSYNSTTMSRTSVRGSGDLNDSKLNMNFLVHIKCERGDTSIIIEPVLRIINLLPCKLICKFGEMNGIGKGRKFSSSMKEEENKDICKKEIISIETSEDAKVLSVHPVRKPHLSLRLPGYKWSLWHRIVNRGINTNTWFPNDKDESNRYQENEVDLDHANEYKSVIRLDRHVDGGDSIVVIIGVEFGHCPVLRVWAQYWIIDKTGFGIRFADDFSGILGNTPTENSSRRSYIDPFESKDGRIIKDLKLSGHQWAIGMSGMSLYFSKKGKIAFRIESGAGGDIKRKAQIKSNWSSSMDISNVMPKTVFSLDEYMGPRKFELALSVSLCPSIFSRTKLITLFPRYQIANLLDQTIFVAQDGCLHSETAIPSQTSVPFHLDISSLAPRVRLSLAFNTSRTFRRSVEATWTNGCIRLDKIGITSMRLPASGNIAKPMVVQAEVRLATPQQSSAVVIVIWSTNEVSNPLYLLRNKSSYTILCSQQCDDDETYEKSEPGFSTNENNLQNMHRVPHSQNDPLSHVLQCQNSMFQIQEEGNLECGAISPLLNQLFMSKKKQEYVWRIPRDKVMCFGFEDPEKAHVIKWTCLDIQRVISNKSMAPHASLEVDGMGSSSILNLGDGRKIMCHIKAEHSTKIIEFTDWVEYSNSAQITSSQSVTSELESLLREEEGCITYNGDEDGDDDFVSLKFRLDLLGLAISVVDNDSDALSGREILYVQSDSLLLTFSQSREGYHEIELRLMSFQVDNHVANTAHPVLIFCPRIDKNEPFLHVAAVRRLESHSSTYVFRYAALRVLDIDIFLDRSTAETIAAFLEPLRKVKQDQRGENPHKWIKMMTTKMADKYSKPDRRTPRDLERMILTANSGRIYFEQLHLHPIRFSLTFTQEWMYWNPATEGLIIFQFIRGMASIAGAPLTFTSFVVNHAFEAPQAFGRIIGAHYSSQLTKQIFGIIGSLAILGAPADFLANVGTGVRDFFYEPINGIIHGPQQFIEGLEAGTQSLARGLVVGVTRGAANVTDVVNSNLVGLTADDDFINERAAHRRMLTDALSRGIGARTVSESLFLAGASVARGVKSGAMGIVEQPTRYASRHGAGGLIQGVGKALVGAVVKPVIGIGDAAVLMMNHVSEATSDKVQLLRIPKRLRRALPRVAIENGKKSVQLLPYDEKAAKAQKIVTAGESIDDIYIGHINTSTHLIIASERSLWAISRHNRKPWCFSWEELSHFSVLDNRNMKITIFSQAGFKPFLFKVDNAKSLSALYDLLSMQVAKMGNCPANFSNIERIVFSEGLEQIFHLKLPGIKTKQDNHVFGTVNSNRKPMTLLTKDVIEVIEQCYARVKLLGSEQRTFFQSLDIEAWTLISSWGQVYSGLSSKRCLVAGFINGTGEKIQVKSTMLVEGGSPCYAIPSKEYDQEEDILDPGGAIILFGWGAVPSLAQAGRVFMTIETSAFLCALSDRKSTAKTTFATAFDGFEVGFLEKSFDENEWWAKYWLLVRKTQI